MLQPQPTKVLDEGFVKLINWMGPEESIIEAARMSTSGGFVSWDPYPEHPKGDLGLLTYLYREGHHTPFEMCDLLVEVRLPIFVAREWMRHRTLCLRGSTQVTCIAPSGSSYKRSIKEIYDLKYGGVVDTFGKVKNGTSKAGTPVTRARRPKVATRTRILPNCQHRTLKVLDEANGEFVSAEMSDVCESGVKPIFEVRTEKGQTIGASADHLFYTKEGWKKLKELQVGDLLATPGLVASEERPYQPALRQGIGVWTSMMRKRLIHVEDRCYVCEGIFPFSFLELDHVVPVVQELKRALDDTNLKPICRECHSLKTAKEQVFRQSKTKQGIHWTPVVSISESGAEMTYDISVEAPHHNFLADGVVVHNSYNELSARYTQMPNLHYVPPLERMVRQSDTNKQGSALEPLDPHIAGALQSGFRNEQEEIYDRYENSLELGLVREVARVNTPVSRYTQMRVKGNLRNWLHFLSQRMAPNAQQEIRVYANAVAEIVKQHWPRTYELFEEWDLHGKRLSRTQVRAHEEAVKRVAAYEAFLDKTNPGWRGMLPF